MGICHETEPAIGEGLSRDGTGVQELAPEDQVDRTLHLLSKQEASERERQDVVPQRRRADPREQILDLYDEFRPRLHRYIHSMYLRRDQADEVIQETFMRLTAELLKENDIENVQGWIVRVAHNLAVDVLKKSGRDAGRACEITTYEVLNVVDPALGPEEAYLKKEQARGMEMALLALNPQHRQCFQMRAQGFRYKDIGLALGISEQRASFVVKQVAVRLAAICG
jgi:RNA polymerase sigma factor (sigma-70 family)